MKILGKVTFKDGSLSNHVTVEGARSLIGCLSSNSMAFISNILFITDFSKMEELSAVVSGNLHNVTWDTLYNGGDPFYDKSICLGVTSDKEDKSGTILLVEGESLNEVITLRANCYVEAGVAPSGGFTIHGMALVLNGRGTTMEGAKQSGYVPTEGGSERVICFVRTNTQVYPNLDNEFRWDLIFDVSK